MRKLLSRKFFVLLLSTLMILMLMPMTAFAAEEGTIDVVVAISVAGEVIVANETVTVSDVDGIEGFDFCDVMIAAHEQFAPNGAADFAFSDNDWGISVDKLWGDTSYNFGYYINDEMAWSADQAVSEGDYVHAYIFQDTETFSDAYAYFDQKFAEITESETLTLTLTAAIGWNEDWTPNFQPYAGAQVGYYEGDEFVVLGTTDENGQVELTFPEAGTYVVTAIGATSTVEVTDDDDTQLRAAGDGGDVLVPPIAVVTVSEEEDEEPTDEEPTDEEPTDEEPTDEEPTDEEPVDEETVDEEPAEEETAEEPVDVVPAPVEPGGAPNTGDTADFIPWSVLCLSAASLAVAMETRRRRA